MTSVLPSASSHINGSGLRIVARLLICTAEIAFMAHGIACSSRCLLHHDMPGKYDRKTSTQPCSTAISIHFFRLPARTREIKHSLRGITDTSLLARRPKTRLARMAHCGSTIFYRHTRRYQNGYLAKERGQIWFVGDEEGVSVNSFGTGPRLLMGHHDIGSLREPFTELNLSLN